MLDVCSSTELLRAWGAYRRNEINREMGIKAGVQPASGAALEVDPEIPHLTPSEQEIDCIGQAISKLSDYHRLALRDVYIHQKIRMVRNRNFKERLRNAQKNFIAFYESPY